MSGRRVAAREPDEVPAGSAAQAPRSGSRRAALLAERAVAVPAEVPPAAVPAQRVPDPEPAGALDAPAAARPRRPARRFRAGLLLLSLQLASIAYLSALGGLLWWSNAPMLVGWQPKVVLTGSMLPVIRPGDVALVGPAQPRDPFALPPGRIVLVRDPSRESGSYLHRVVRYEDNGFLVTKGDANPTEDHPSVDPARVRGQVRLLVPAIGRPVVWVHDHRYPMLAGSLALTWLAVAVTLAARGRADDEDDAGDAPEAAEPASGAPDDGGPEAGGTLAPDGTDDPTVAAGTGRPAVGADPAPALTPERPEPAAWATVPAPAPAAPPLPRRRSAGPPDAAPSPAPGPAPSAAGAAQPTPAEPSEAPGDTVVRERTAALGRPSVEEVLTALSARPPAGDVVLPDAGVLPGLELADPTPPGAVPPAPDRPTPEAPADRGGQPVLSDEAERLVQDLDAFEAVFGAAFGAAFGADDDEDVTDFDGRGFS